jgi:hypothetical protein
VRAQGLRAADGASGGRIPVIGLRKDEMEQRADGGVFGALGGWVPLVGRLHKGFKAGGAVNPALTKNPIPV